MRHEFDRQVENLIQKGYHAAAGVEEEDFRRRLDPLRERVGSVARLENCGEAARIPFAIVVKPEMVAADKAMSLVEFNGRRGFASLHPVAVEDFKPIASIVLPSGMAYLVVDVDTGKATLNVTPDEALGTIASAHRSPLTLDEGIALVTHHPTILKRHNCFSLLGSRRGDRRVTALWISGGRPRLGWCWAGNPHTWLGSASCGRRVGA